VVGVSEQQARRRGLIDSKFDRRTGTVEVRS